VKQTESCVEYAAPFDAWEAAGYSGTVAISTGGEPVCLAAYGTADVFDAGHARSSGSP